jgi:hypothetical protein
LIPLKETLRISGGEALLDRTCTTISIKLIQSLLLLTRIRSASRCMADSASLSTIAWMIAACCEWMSFLFESTLEDVTLSETLRAADYKTALIADLLHLFKPDRNFHRGFDSFQWICGQEIDALGVPDRKPLICPSTTPEYLDLVQQAKQFAHGQPFSKFLEQYTYREPPLMD